MICAENRINEVQLSTRMGVNVLHKCGRKISLNGNRNKTKNKLRPDDDDDDDDDV